MATDIKIFTDNGKVMFTGKTITGSALLSQRLLIIFLTRMDEALRAEEGTIVPSLFYDGINGYDDMTIQNLIAIAASKAVESYEESVTDDTPDTERVASYTLNSYTRNIDSVEISMTLTTVAGESYTMEGSV